MQHRIQNIFAWIAVGTSVVSVVLLAFFLLGIVPSFSINSPSWITISPGWVVNALLILVFGLQHSVMARPWFKKYLCTIVPEKLERSFYVFWSGITLAGISLLWQPLPEIIWRIENPIGTTVLHLIFVTGSLVALLAIIAIDAYDLIGFRQAGIVQKKKMTFRRSWLHNQVRHPIYSGLLLIFWATPQMTVGHLMFAVCMTLYIRIGIFFEERQLTRTFGEEYRNYIKEVPMLIPLL